MEFEVSRAGENTGYAMGFVFSYLLFTTVAYFLFVFLGKLPSSWTYYHMAGVTATITIVGAMTKRLLK